MVLADQGGYWHSFTGYPADEHAQSPLVEAGEIFGLAGDLATYIQGKTRGLLFIKAGHEIRLYSRGLTSDG